MNSKCKCLIWLKKKFGNDLHSIQLLPLVYLMVNIKEQNPRIKKKVEIATSMCYEL